MSDLAVICPKRLVRRQCAEAFGVDEARMIGGNRAREVINPRHATCYVLRHRFPKMSLPRIGALMGGRDHSTILHGIRRIEALMERDPALREKVQALVAGRSPAPHNAHVMAWRDWLQAQHEADQRKVERAAAVSTLAKGHEGHIAEGVRLINLTRDVKPKNSLPDDDRDAVRRKVGSDALSRAVAAAGGWRR